MTKHDEKNNQKTEQDEQIDETSEGSVEEKATLALQEKLADFENKYKRALADYQNLQKRSLEERREWIQSANKTLITRFLTILDTLQMARKHSEDKSLEVSIKQFEDLLKDEGITKIETVGKEFNPHTMECVQTVAGAENIVIDELRAGYMLYDKLLRPSQVTVGNGKN